MTTSRAWSQPAATLLYEKETFTRVENAVIAEDQVCIFLNGQELATLMCSPYRLEELSIGFLRSEGLVKSLEDIDILKISDHERCVDVWLKDLSVRPPEHRILTSGCGGSLTFTEPGKHKSVLKTKLKMKASQVNHLMGKLLLVTDLYREIGGVHTSALSNTDDLLLVAEDMGLNNTIDRLWGQALQQGLSTAGLHPSVHRTHRLRHPRQSD